MLKNLLLVACSCAVALLLSEVTIRIVDGLNPVRILEPHPILGWTHVSGARMVWTKEGHGLIKINEAGYRDYERAPTPPPDTYRIAIFGDSQTAGFQVNLEATYGALIEKTLQKSGRDVEVLNFGVNGYSPVQEWLLFREIGASYNPDLVILATFLDNDISGVDPALTVSQSGVPIAYFNNGEARFDLSRAEESFRSYHMEPLYTLRKYLATYRLLSKVRRNFQTRTGIGGLPTRYELYTVPLGERWESAWKVVERITLGFAKDVQAIDAEFLLLSIPAAQVVTSKSWANIVKKYPAMESLQWDLYAPETRFAKIASQNNFSLVQPFQKFQQQTLLEPEVPLFFGNVGHLTPRGHRLLAENLLPVIETYYDKNEREK